VNDRTAHPEDTRLGEPGEIVDFEEDLEFGPLPPTTGDARSEKPDVPTVEVRRRASLAALVGIVAAGVATAYLTRAIDTGGAASWAVFGLMAVVAVAFLSALVDARTPLLVADDHGIRIRLGRSWAGLTWGSLLRVEVVPQHGLRDGRLVLVPRNAEKLLAELDAGGRRASRLTQRLYVAPFAVPLSIATRVVGADPDVVTALRSLAAGRVDVSMVAVVTVEDIAAEVPSDVPSDVPEEVPADEPTHPWHDPRPAIAHSIGVVAARLRLRSASEAPVDDPVLPEPVVASAPPSPLRDLVSGRRTEVRRDLVAGANALKTDHAEEATKTGLPEAFVLQRPGAVDLEVDQETWGSYGDGVRPIAVPGEALDTIVIDDFAIEPAEDPVIGPEFAAARTRLGLSVDQLAERTRIRPHVIESIEVDDFVPCGGDFYARGHIRTLARILGIDAAPLLASYDERYADAPVNPRRVFEAELAHSGGIRATRGGPNWSVLVAAVMALVLAWSIARLVMDGPVDLRDEPVLNGSGGPNHKGVPAAPAVPVVISAPSSGARVIVRDGAGSVVFTGDVAFGGTKTLSVSPPVRVQATDGSVTVTVDGEDHGPLGASGSPGSGTFVVR
jgi:cytoskeleton protein RodZ